MAGRDGALALGEDRAHALPPACAARALAPSQSAKGKVGLVTATVFADSEEEARSLLEPLTTCPVADPLSELGPKPTDFLTLIDLSGSMWPENQGAHVDAMFFDTNPAELVRTARPNFMRAFRDDAAPRWGTTSASRILSAIPSSPRARTPPPTGRGSRRCAPGTTPTACSGRIRTVWARGARRKRVGAAGVQHSAKSPS
jgi:hypothetical protein